MIDNKCIYYFCFSDFLVIYIIQGVNICNVNISTKSNSNIFIFVYFFFIEQSNNIIASSQTTVIQSTSAAQSLRQISNNVAATTSSVQLSSIKQTTQQEIPNAAVLSTTLPTTIGSKIQQIVPESEQFAVAWLRATFEPVNVTSRIEQQDLYKMYLTASSKVGRSGVLSPMHFPRCVRSVFGNSVGPNTVKLKQSNLETHTMYYESIRIRSKPLAVIHKGTVLQASVQTSDVIVKKPEIQSIAKLSQVGQTDKPILVSQLTGKNVIGFFFYSLNSTYFLTIIYCFCFAC